MSTWDALSIFKASNLVTAWLGPEDETTALGKNQIRKVAAVAEVLEEDELPRKEDVSTKESENLGISFEDTARWHALSTVFNCPWFERIWIVQEMLPAQDQEASAKIEAQVVVGPHVLSWDAVKLAASWAWCKGDNRPKPEDMEVDGISLTVSMRLHWVSRFARMHSRKESLGRFHFRALSLLEQFRNRLATDPKDKIYALLGLSDLDIGFELEVQSRVTIDYTRSVLRVFRDTTTAIIEHSTNLDRSTSLDILISATPRSEEDGWPTWVPDWRITDIRDAGVRLFRGNPAGDIQLRVFEPPDENSLKVASAIIGSARYVHTERHAVDIIWRGDLRALQRYYVDSLSASTYLTGEDTATAFTLTLSAGRVPQSVKEAGTTTEGHTNSIFDFIDALKLPRNTEDEKARRYVKIAPFTEMGFDTKWFDIYARSCCERRFFTTDSGHLGLGNHHMVAGDVIAILFGLHVPCVLRPLSDKPEDGYAFIGEAYLHGAMNGEAIKDLPKGVDGLVSSVEILLC
jgi:hypothetical protein